MAPSSFGTFAYGGQNLVLDGVSFAIPAGTRLGIAGRTGGAGKSTLISLLMRFYDPTMGQILLDGTDLRDLKMADLRHQFAMVLQEPVLFSMSIPENIAMGVPEADFRSIVAVPPRRPRPRFQEASRRLRYPGRRARHAHVRGRAPGVALARGLLEGCFDARPDQPMSSVDTGTEAAIMDAMQRLMVGGPP